MFATKLLFQSTLPLRGVTEFFNEWNSYNKFQSTLPLRGVTIFPCVADGMRTYFNPHSPCGE